MKKILKIIGGLVPFLGTHLICCGALLYFLWSSGLLLVIAREGRSRVFLVPILAMGIIFFLIHRNHKKAFLNFLFFLGFYVMMSLAFIIYIFIPWWIPGYDGGLILP